MAYAASDGEDRHCKKGVKKTGREQIREESYAIMAGSVRVIFVHRFAAELRSNNLDSSRQNARRVLAFFTQP